MSRCISSFGHLLFLLCSLHKRRCEYMRLCGFVCTCLTCFWRFLTSFSRHPVSLSLFLYSVTAGLCFPANRPAVHTNWRYLNSVYVRVCGCVCTRACVYLCGFEIKGLLFLFFVGACVRLLFTRLAGRKQSDTHSHTLWGLGNLQEQWVSQTETLYCPFRWRNRCLNSDSPFRDALF